jgi:hypothetical protein
MDPKDPDLEHYRYRTVLEMQKVVVLMSIRIRLSILMPTWIHVWILFCSFEGVELTELHAFKIKLEQML